ncbi:MAG: hypothetical protein M3R25_13950 [Bacteroidota bacterium]|nr:hypothetical protein [Bacteroidota bacterium]
MSEPFNFEEAGRIYEQTMKGALANIDAISADLLKQQEKAIADQIVAQGELKRIQRGAETISAASINQHRKEYDEKVRQDLLRQITKKLILTGRSVEEIFEWLEVKEDVILKAWDELGFRKLGEHLAHVGYEDAGKAGYVIFYRDDLILRFPYEFGGGLTLANVDVPSEQDWTASTNISLEERMPTLEFIANRIIRDQAAEHKYKIEKDRITIYLQ